MMVCFLLMQVQFYQCDPTQILMISSGALAIETMVNCVTCMNLIKSQRSDRIAYNLRLCGIVLKCITAANFPLTRRAITIYLYSQRRVLLPSRFHPQFLMTSVLIFASSLLFITCRGSGIITPMLLTPFGLWAMKARHSRSVHQAFSTIPVAVGFSILSLYYTGWTFGDCSSTVYRLVCWLSALEVVPEKMLTRWVSGNLQVSFLDYYSRLSIFTAFATQNITRAERFHSPKKSINDVPWSSLFNAKINWHYGLIILLQYLHIPEKNSCLKLIYPWYIRGGFFLILNICNHMLNGATILRQLIYG
jgi:hypothetical protein